MGQESMSECELLRAEIESLKIDLQAMLGLRRTGSTSTIEKRLERVEAILDARGLDWDHPRVEEEPAPVDFGDKDHPVVMRQTMVFSLSQSDKNQPPEEPPKKWRRLTDEFVQPGDWANAKVNRQDVDPPDGGWITADPYYFGRRACTLSMYFARPVSDEPAKEPDPVHPAGPMPDPGKAYRLLSKDPPEDLQPKDEYRCRHEKQWIESNRVREGYRNQLSGLWYRRKVEPPKPAWEPKVGDWVRVTRPEDWIEWKHPRWEGSMHKSDGMHKFDGQVGQIEREREGHFQIRGFVASKECSYIFHRDWLSPAEPPKAPQPEYRDPVLPADGGMACEFSEEGNFWSSGRLGGVRIGKGWFSTGGVCWRHCRIKKDA